jgi:glutathione synthase/RimK-type ligase-like ATP-grasp enzyme
LQLKKRFFGGMMSLYGLDIITSDERILLEINGINSGMIGFSHIYGDKRVERRVSDMLRRKYGKITVNDGSYLWRKYAQNHPFRAFFHVIRKRCFTPKILQSSKADITWMHEKTKHHDYQGIEYEIYNGQESTVLNSRNQILPHPLVNPFVAEDITRNKFLQYLVLKDTELKDSIPKTALVGLGFTDEKTLEESLDNNSWLIIKPVLGSRGMGCRPIKKDEAAKYLKSRGPYERLSPIEILTGMNGGNTHKYLEHYIECNNYTFEPGLSIIQPFVDSRTGDGRYSIIRAIVCNGKFVDAYRRVSENPKVNLSQDAEAEPCKDDISGLCENIVQIFEEQCSQYEPDTYRKTLYQQYVEERGKTSDDERKNHAFAPLANAVMKLPFKF